MDPLSFTAIRLLSGALVLLTIARVRSPGRTPDTHRPRYSGPLYLLLYALPFSLAYTRLETGTGALLLFGAVQLTMISVGILRGERPRPLEVVGILGAAFGVVVLVAPGVRAPSPLGAALMIVAGVGWGLYSLAGKNAASPLRETARNFLWAAIVAVPLTAAFWSSLRAGPTGAALATASGAIASGLGYSVWFAALAYLSATRAALVQLAVPVLAAFLGVSFLGEAWTPRLLLASTLILGSIALGTLQRNRQRAMQT